MKMASIAILITPLVVLLVRYWPLTAMTEAGIGYRLVPAPV